MELQVFIAKTCARLAMHFTVLKGGSFLSYLPTNELPSSGTFLLSVSKWKEGNRASSGVLASPTHQKEKNFHTCTCMCECVHTACVCVCSKHKVNVSIFLNWFPTSLETGFLLLLFFFFFFFGFSRLGFSVVLEPVLELALVDQAGLKLTAICLPLPPECWD